MVRHGMAWHGTNSTVENVNHRRLHLHLHLRLSRANHIIDRLTDRPTRTAWILTCPTALRLLDIHKTTRRLLSSSLFFSILFYSPLFTIAGLQGSIVEPNNKQTNKHNTLLTVQRAMRQDRQHGACIGALEHGVGGGAV
jgi:hypothetical protein